MISGVEQPLGRQTLHLTRSTLVQAGSHSLGLISYPSTKHTLKDASQVKQISAMNNVPQGSSVTEMNVKLLIQKLTLPRLRKMQALVRGFLTRRLIYPPLKEEYILACSILELISMNVVYRVGSELMVSSMALFKYERENIDAEQVYCQEQIYNKLVHLVCQKELKGLAEKTILERAHLISQPKITFGLNIRDPMQLLLYEKLVQFIRVQAKEIAETSVREHAVSIREDLMMQEWIKQFGLLRKICWQAANEAIMESVDQYMTDHLVDRIALEGCQIVANVCYKETVRGIQQQREKQLEREAAQWLIQEGVLSWLLGKGYGTEQ